MGGSSSFPADHSPPSNLVQFCSLHKKYNDALRKFKIYEELNDIIISLYSIQQSNERAGYSVSCTFQVFLE
jgi:hypothetical protein